MWLRTPFTAAHPPIISTRCRSIRSRRTEEGRELDSDGGREEARDGGRELNGDGGKEARDGGREGAGSFHSMELIERGKSERDFF